METFKEINEAEDTYSWKKDSHDNLRYTNNRTQKWEYCICVAPRFYRTWDGSDEAHDLLLWKRNPHPYSDDILIKELRDISKEDLENEIQKMKAFVEELFK